MVGTSSEASAGTGTTKHPIRATKKITALTRPAVAGNIKALTVFSRRTAYPRNTLRQLLERSEASAIRSRMANSGGAGRRPSEETSARDLSSMAYSDSQTVHSLRWLETSCISAPLTAPSRYDENRGLASVHLMIVPPLPIGQMYPERA